MPDAWRLAVGTLTAIPVRPPTTVDPQRASAAMVLVPGLRVAGWRASSPGPTGGGP